MTTEIKPDGNAGHRTLEHLLHGSAALFEPDQLERLAPRSRSRQRLSDLNGQGVLALDPLAATEAIAYDFLTRGGKHLRPFVTMAIYDAVRGGRATGWDGARVVAEIPDFVKRAAMSIETFHKASLVHDDIEDDDQFRYGSPSIHRSYGIPTAINVGDYLIGLGYRLVSASAAEMGGDVAAEILNYLAESHLRLAEGQGAELLWRESPTKRITPDDVREIYALKTAPAFEAAILTGMRLAGPVLALGEPAKHLSRDLGIAFQILNDLSDWQGDSHNKLSRGLDLISGRPTLPWALALEALDTSEQDRLVRTIHDVQLPVPVRIAEAAQIYADAGIFEKSLRLVEKYESHCRAIVDDLELEPLQRVLRYLIDVILERPDGHSPSVAFNGSLSMCNEPMCGR